MAGKLIIMGGLAMAFGAASYVGGNYYLESQSEALARARMNALENNRPVVQEVETAKVVVASVELKFGEVIDDSKLKVIDWPQDSFPEGAFAATSEVVLNGKRRVLSPIFPGEPILAAKITGKNGRAGLAGLIGEGKRAITIPVDAVNGVAGFVQPGDFVDILLIKGRTDEEGSISKTFMENVKILSVDQNAGSRSETAQLARSVTIETDTKGAKKIAWGLNVGTLSLTLRSTGDSEITETPENEDKGLLSSLFFTEEEKPKTTSIKVVSGQSVQQFRVDIEEAREPKKENKNNN